VLNKPAEPLSHTFQWRRNKEMLGGGGGTCIGDSRIFPDMFLNVKEKERDVAVRPQKLAIEMLAILFKSLRQL
jgi:hypothetical protein